MLPYAKLGLLLVILLHNGALRLARTHLGAPVRLVLTRMNLITRNRALGTFGPLTSEFVLKHPVARSETFNVFPREFIGRSTSFIQVIQSCFVMCSASAPTGAHTDQMSNFANSFSSTPSANWDFY